MPSSETTGATDPEPARRHARTVLGRLKRRYPVIGTALRHDDPWQLLVSTVLSAQTTDETVNRVTPELFRRWPTADDLAAADPEEVEALVYPTGFDRQKTRSIIGLSREIAERFGGEVPADLDSLVTLPGVGRKTASVVLVEAWNQEAIAVDTHVRRVARRLGLTEHSDPAKVEKDLRELYPRWRWPEISMRFIQFGRDTCHARRPRCWNCILSDRCPYPDKTEPPDSE